MDMPDNEGNGPSAIPLGNLEDVMDNAGIIPGEPVLMHQEVGAGPDYVLLFLRPREPLTERSDYRGETSGDFMDHYDQYLCGADLSGYQIERHGTGFLSWGEVSSHNKELHLTHMLMDGDEAMAVLGEQNIRELLESSESWFRPYAAAVLDIMMNLLYLRNAPDSQGHYPLNNVSGGSEILLVQREDVMKKGTSTIKDFSGIPKYRGRVLINTETEPESAMVSYNNGIIDIITNFAEDIYAFRVIANPEQMLSGK